jgi:hypothetical protein
MKRSIERAKVFFRDWIIHIHVDASINGELLKELSSHANVKIINHAKKNEIAPVFDLLGKRFVCPNP